MPFTCKLGQAAPAFVLIILCQSLADGEAMSCHGVPVCNVFDGGERILWEDFEVLVPGDG